MRKVEDIIRAGVGDEQEARVGRDDDRVLRRQVRLAVAAAAGGLSRGRGQPAIGGALVEHDLVGASVVGLREDEVRSAGIHYDPPRGCRQSSPDRTNPLQAACRASGRSAASVTSEARVARQPDATLHLGDRERPVGVVRIPDLARSPDVQALLETLVVLQVGVLGGLVDVDEEGVAAGCLSVRLCLPMSSLVTTPASFACIPALTLCTSATGTVLSGEPTARTMLLTSGLLDGFLAESGSHPRHAEAHSAMQGSVREPFTPRQDSAGGPTARHPGSRRSALPPRSTACIKGATRA